MYDVRSMYGVNADSDLTTDMVKVLNAAGKTGYSVGDKADMSVLETLQYAGYSTPDGSTLVSRPSVTTVGEPLTPNSPGLKDYVNGLCQRRGRHIRLRISGPQCHEQSHNERGH
jgi:hypothetical protein